MDQDDIDEGRKLLIAAELFYDHDEDEPKLKQTLNQNDVWGWAYAFGQHVSDEEIPEVARLFRSYGWCGILYWVSEKNEKMESEFEDNNRFIEFVRNEERIRIEIPDYNKRAYAKYNYVIGQPK